MTRYNTDDFLYQIAGEVQDHRQQIESMLTPDTVVVSHLTIPQARLFAAKQ